MTSVEGLVCLSLILFSAYLSASEVALFSLSRFQLRSLKENFRITYRKIKQLQSDPGGLLITLLVLNEVINIALSTLIASALSRTLIFKNPSGYTSRFFNIPSWAIETLFGIAVTAPIILIFCEITPKVIGTRMNRLVATLTAHPLTFIYKLFRPLQFCLKKFIWLFSNQKKTVTSLDSELLDPKRKATILKESDFLLLLEEGRKEGAIQETELDMIRNVFELDNITVYDIATPLSQVLTLNAKTTVKEALAIIRSRKFSRIPVVGTNKKEILGLLYAKDLLRSKLQPEGLSAHVATLMRKPFFVSSSTHVGALFRKFKQQQTHMAIVKNSLGEVLGIVTMNDVLDALFEDLFEADELERSTPHSAGEKP